MIPVTKPFLPPIEKYQKYIEEIWQRGWLTNHGPLVKELEAKLKGFIDVPYFYFCTNGTVVLQMALKALDITGEVITTPFSYVATTSALLWENCIPVFTDINESDCNIDPAKIEEAITPKTTGILATHVYGNPCDVEAIEAIAKKNNLKVIYDAAHAFGTLYKGKSLLGYGDISTCSFHATKLFHTVEGGCIVCTDEALGKKIYLQRQFGHVADEHFSLGINGKNSEFHAAMGLCNFDHLTDIIKERKKLSELYKELLSPNVSIPQPIEGTSYNYAYFPVIFAVGEMREKVTAKLNAQDIFPRRYFFPSLNKLSYLEKKYSCPVSESMSERVLTLPLYVGLQEEDVKKITSLINECV